MREAAVIVRELMLFDHAFDADEHTVLYDYAARRYGLSARDAATVRAARERLWVRALRQRIAALRAEPAPRLP